MFQSLKLQDEQDLLGEVAERAAIKGIQDYFSLYSYQDAVVFFGQQVSDGFG